ncbi:MAG: S-layer homology domain-containing protein [Firmicutes bacterium]|nr:S-layer homology domain-containing protein [Bacillota bacterium]
MFYRTLNAVHPSLVAESFEVTFADIDDISEWALEAIGFMSNKGIISGVGENMVAPKGNATREQAIALVIRTYELFKDAEIEEPIVEEEVEGEPEEGEPEEGDENGEEEPGDEDTEE